MVDGEHPDDSDIFSYVNTADGDDCGDIGNKAI